MWSRLTMILGLAAALAGCGDDNSVAVTTTTEALTTTTTTEALTTTTTTEALTTTTTTRPEPSPTVLLDGLLTLYEQGEAVDEDTVVFPGLAIERIDDENCRGTGDYAEVTIGARVTVRDQGGQILGTGSLIRPRDWWIDGVYGAPSLEQSWTSTEGQVVTDVVLTGMVTCNWEFRIEDLPSDRADYLFTIGQRDVLVVSQALLQAASWHVTLPLNYP